MAQSAHSSLNLNEVAAIAIGLDGLTGAQLQDCLQTESELGLAFYHERETLWLWIDLDPKRPVVVRLKAKPAGRKKLVRPLMLFLKSRFLGRRLTTVRMDPSLGRVLLFTFSRSPEEDVSAPPELEVRLFPRGQNIIARDGKSSIAVYKPKELTAHPEAASSDDTDRTPQSWEQIEESWRQTQTSPVGATKAVSGQAARDSSKEEREWQRAIEKKTKALERMREELEAKLDPTFALVGEWLKTNTSLEVPPEWRSYVDATKSLSANINQVFQKAKDNHRKAEGTRARIALVEKEVEDLKKRGPRVLAKKTEAVSKAAQASLLARADAKGRRLKVGEDLEAYIGKSAADNLALLRKAQPFDYWLHLRDQPGSHAIMRRTRGRVVTDAEFTTVGQWVIEQSLGRRASELKGERHDLLIVECRFVRPIKGDKLGRVNYTNDRVLRIAF